MYSQIQGLLGQPVLVGGILLALVYLLYYVRGQRVNDQLFAAWHRGLFKAQWHKRFALVGTSTETSDLTEAPPISQMLVQRLSNEQAVYGSGRLHVERALVKLSLRSRQDLVASYLLPKLSFTHDQLDLIFHLPRSDPFIFGLLRKPLVTQLKQEQWCLRQFAKFIGEAQDAQLPLLQLTFYADHGGQMEVLPGFLRHQGLLKGLLSFQSPSDPSVSLLNYVVISDQPLQDPTEDLDVDLLGFNPQLRMNLTIPDHDPEEVVERLTQEAVAYALMLTDWLGQSKVGCLNAEAKAKSMKQRQAVMEQLQKKKQKLGNEEAQKKKYQRQQEKYKEWEQLPREQRKKLEEKEAKKLKKRSSGKVKVMKA